MDEAHIFIMEYENINWVKVHPSISLTKETGKQLLKVANDNSPKLEILGFHPEKGLIQVHADTNLTLLRVKKVIA